MSKITNGVTEKRRPHTNLSDALEDSDADDGREVAETGEERREGRQKRRPEDAEQQRSLAADLVCQQSAGDLRRHVAIEERRQDDALHLLVPDEVPLDLNTDTDGHCQLTYRQGVFYTPLRGVNTPTFVRHPRFIS